MKKIILIVVIIVAIIIAAVVGYNYYVAQQQKKIATELDTMVTDLKTAGKNVSQEGNQLTNLSVVQDQISQDIAELKIIQESNFNNATLKQKETEISETLTYLQAYINLYNNVETMDDNAQNLGNAPTINQLTNVLDECKSILEGSDLKTLEDNVDNNDIKAILDKSTLPSVSDVKTDLINEITQLNNAIAIEQFYGLS